MNILADIHILVLATNIPGPTAAHRLSELGASITKVEPPTGDALHHACPQWYKKLHRHQSIQTLDLKNDKELSKLGTLIAQQDILITALRPPALKKYKLDWNTLRHKYPNLCMTHISGCAPPQDDLPEHDLTAQARSGLLDSPHLPRVLVADLLTAARVVSAVLGLLFQRERSLISGYLNISLQESAELLNDSIQFEMTTPNGILGGGTPAYNLYPTAQGWIALAALEPHFWKRLQEACDRKNPTYNDLKDFFKTKSAKDWEQWAMQLDMPLAAVQSLKGDKYEIR